MARHGITHKLYQVSFIREIELYCESIMNGEVCKAIRDHFSG